MKGEFAHATVAARPTVPVCAGRTARHRVALTAMAMAAAVVYAGFGLMQLDTFHTTTYDLVIFDQAVRSYAHFQPGIAMVKGVHDGSGPTFSILGDHWSPILAVLAPLYWLAAAPQTLIVTQAAAFAAAIPLVWMFARRLASGVGSRAASTVAYSAAGAYALSWPLAGAVAFGFHEVAFVPVLTAAFFERMHAGRPRAALLAAAILLLVKEDMGLLVTGFGLWLLVARARVPRQRQLAAGMMAGGIAATSLATLVLRPAFGGRAMYYWAYDALGRNVPQAAWHAISDPLAVAHLLFTPGEKLSTMAWLAGSLLLLPLLSPISLAAVPLLAERMLASSHPDWWGLRYHYNAFIVVVLVCAAVDGGMRLSSWLAAHTRMRQGRLVAGIAALCCAAAVALVPVFPLGAALRPSFYRLTQRDRAAAAAVATVPSGVTVEAVNRVGPQLCGRDAVLLWDWMPRWAPWVVADTQQRAFPFTSLREQQQRVRLLLRNGYRMVLARDGYVVLHRYASPSGRRCCVGAPKEDHTGREHREPPVPGAGPK